MNRARVVACTRPTDEDMSVDEFIAYVARVSNPSNQTNHETAPKLIKHLLSNKHWSPLEMAHVVMEIDTTRDIARQILRHRSFSFQEFSQRYADPTKDLGFTTREARLQDTKNRQNSIEVADQGLSYQWTDKQQEIIHAAKIAYDWAIKNGIAKEQARSVLPEGLTKSRMYMTGSVRSWVHYCQLRMTAGTQKEHREVAIDCWYNLIREFPSLKDLNLISP
ncbi:THY1 Predicted alternative thymidylate synthase [uncultured Caudovirales phage]|uniref:THY1 Predicted alternative thymidylate synthase n=1 Tax=uncultured Caudovirales phage TaxID=2100421 RepID=A0A6J7WVI7_9CAUD|nr:THY1 Predicted alternative thymidylate synthase [uncultured Caudovirales phage]